MDSQTFLRNSYCYYCVKRRHRNIQKYSYIHTYIPVIRIIKNIKHEKNSSISVIITITFLFFCFFFLIFVSVSSNTLSCQPLNIVRHYAQFLALNFSKKQISQLNVCWNNAFRKKSVIAIQLKNLYVCVLKTIDLICLPEQRKLIFVQKLLQSSDTVLKTCANMNKMSSKFTCLCEKFDLCISNSSSSDVEGKMMYILF